MIHEPRITMHKEVLRIGAEKVSVDYEFRNDTDSDITTEVAFPVPAYSLMWDEYLISTLGFDDFRLTVEGKPVHFGIETKAKLNGKDVSAVLDRYGIDIATFGHFNQDTHYAKDIRSLSAAQRSALVRTGLINPETDQDEANWSIEKKYHWKQTFPTHAIIHISHQYTPVLGGMNSVRYGLAKEDPDATKELASLCINPGLHKELVGEISRTLLFRFRTWISFSQRPIPGRRPSKTSPSSSNDLT